MLHPAKLADQERRSTPVIFYYFRTTTFVPVASKSRVSIPPPRRPVSSSGIDQKNRPVSGPGGRDAVMYHVSMMMWLSIHCYYGHTRIYPNLDTYHASQMIILYYLSCMCMLKMVDRTRYQPTTFWWPFRFATN